MKLPSLLCTVLGLSSLLSAAEVDMKPTHISLFENGYGFITQRATLPDATQVRLNSLPVPVRGSFWIATEEGVQVNRLVSGLLDYEVSVPLELFQLAAANAGAPVRVTFRRGKQGPIDVVGIILPFPQAREERVGNTIDQISEPSKNPLIGSVLLLKVHDQTLMLRQSQVIDIAFLDDLKMPTRTERRAGVELELAQAAKGKIIESTALSSGITWLPSYSLELYEDGSAELRAKATITNKLMNMENIALDLVLGSPQLSNLSSIDPMALRNISPQARARAKSHEYGDMMLSAGSHFDVEHSFDSEYAPPAKALSTGNVYFYPIDSFSAKAGQVVTQPLFQSPLRYKNVYTWTLPDPIRMPNSDPEQPPTIGAILREVHFENPLDIPLVAAPIELIETNRIASTDRIALTPPKTAAVVEAGKAINLTTRQNIRHVGTTKLSFPHPSKEGEKLTKTTTTQTYVVTLHINNQMEKPAELIVTQSVQGEILHIPSDPSMSATVSPLRQNVHPESPIMGNEIRWKLTLVGQKDKTLSYTFQRSSTRIHPNTEKP